MRSAEDVFRELEEDRASRESEIRLIENFISRSSDEPEKVMLRRTLVLLTYAHLEGFCKFALMAYAASINAIRLPCREAATPLVALTLNNVFAALREVNSKHPAFARLIDDKDLHQIARERAFIEGFERITAQKVEIPDHVVDTKSNLSSLVLKRNLYQLGLEYPVIQRYSSSIDKLLGVRNAIAHGDKLKRPKDSEVREYLSAALEIMKFVQSEIFDALTRKVYQRDPSLTLSTELSFIEKALNKLGFGAVRLG